MDENLPKMSKKPKNSPLRALSGMSLPNIERDSVTLPLGSYHIAETKPPYGYAGTDVAFDVTLAWDNQTQEIVAADAVEFHNEREKAKVGIYKTDLESGKYLAGAVFNLYTADDIYDADGNLVFNGEIGFKTVFDGAEFSLEKLGYGLEEKTVNGKKKYEFKSVVAETLLIPLYMRAKESRRKDAILRDRQAEQLVESIEYDYSKFDGAKLSAIGCVVRGLYFDNAIRRFIATRKNPIVVNVGCGLDTRYQRIEEHDKAIFYEMDLPEVIDLRRDLLPEPAGDHYIAGSLLETQWMDDLRKKHPEGEFIIVIEGVLMYFYEKQVRQLLTRLADRFSGSEVWFDVCGPMMANSKYIKPDSLRGHEAQIRSGLKDGHEVENWEPRLQLIDQALYQKFFPKRWGLGGRLMGLFPGICKKFSSLLGYKIK